MMTVHHRVMLAWYDSALKNETFLLTSSNVREPLAKCINANKNIGVNTTI